METKLETLSTESNLKLGWLSEYKKPVKRQKVVRYSAGTAITGMKTAEEKLAEKVAYGQRNNAAKLGSTITGTSSNLSRNISTDKASKRKTKAVKFTDKMEYKQLMRIAKLLKNGGYKE